MTLETRPIWLHNFHQTMLTTGRGLLWPTNPPGCGRMRSRFAFAASLCPASADTPSRFGWEADNSLQLVYLIPGCRRLTATRPGAEWNSVRDPPASACADMASPHVPQTAAQPMHSCLARVTTQAPTVQESRRLPSQRLCSCQHPCPSPTPLSSPAPHDRLLRLVCAALSSPRLGWTLARSLGSCTTCRAARRLWAPRDRQATHPPPPAWLWLFHAAPR